MDILVIGGGGREHAIVWKLRQSPNAEKIYCAPGNAGMGEIENVELVDISAVDIETLVEFATLKNVGFVVIGPDDPLVLGAADAFESKGFKVFGPRKNAAALEGSKAFAKSFMKRNGIPTADYQTFDNVDDAKAFSEKTANEGKTVVIKADGLALGKGVLICKDYAEAENALNEIFIGKKFGASGKTVVIEEYLEGREVTVLAFCDGKTVVPMISARDHKRALDGDLGLNTGGMGVITSVPDFTDEISAVCMNEIILKTVESLNKESIEYKGIIYFEIMLTPNGPKVIEYNARFGDPEAEALIPLLNCDLLEIFITCQSGNLKSADVKFKDAYAACVVVAAGGYPGDYKKGRIISGIDKAESRKDTIVFHMGTKKIGDVTVTNGGRVLSVVSVGKTHREALRKAYEAVDDIRFEGMFYRRDIGRSSIV